MRDVGSFDDVCEALDVVLFGVCGWRVGIEARGVRGARNAQACAGSGDTAGGIAGQLGLEIVSTAFARELLVLKGSDGADGDRAVLVEAPVDFVSLPVESIYPLPPLLAARTRLNGLRALALNHNTRQVVLLFELSAP